MYSTSFLQYYVFRPEDQRNCDACSEKQFDEAQSHYNSEQMETDRQASSESAHAKIGTWIVLSILILLLINLQALPKCNNLEQY